MIVLPLLKGLLERPLILRELAALTVVCTHPGCSKATIEIELGVAKSTVHGLVNKLLDCGMIEAGLGTTDGRILSLNPTPAGATEYYRLVQLAGMAAAPA